MPVFEYKALNELGKAVSGLKEADSPKSLRAALRKEGMFLTEVLGEAKAGAPPRPGQRPKPSRDIQIGKFARGRITTEDIAVTTRQLATLLGAGVTLVEALTALIDQVEKERFKRVISDIKQRVNEGASLGDALGQHQKIFGSLYVNMVKAGEHSGAMDAVLKRLADFTENQARLRQKILGTLMYPAMMFVVTSGILVLLMAVVVPKVTTVFASVKATLPFTTRLLIGSSNALANYWFIVFPLVIALAAAFVFWTRSPNGKPVWDRRVLHLPVIGRLVRDLSVARFSRTLATLLKSGVPLLSALEIVKAVMTNSVLADVVEKARDAIREGESIAQPLRRSGEFPPLVHHMVAIGERSGQLEDMLLSVADAYEQQVEVRIGALTSLLEPVLIVVMGGVVGFVAFSILMPILQINSALR